MVYHLVNTHDRASCAGHPCCVHNPSDHHMYGWRQHWRVDRSMMERLCRHGVGHPDPDHVDFVRRTRGDDAAWGEATHSCDGCCVRPSDRDDGR